MRILLASAPHADTFGYSMPPPGLLRLGGSLRRDGVEVALEDLAFRQASGALPEDDELAEAAAALLLARGDFEVIGLSSMGATVPVAIAIARHLRAARPGVRLVIGGPGVGGIEEALLTRFEVFDAVVRGEAEVTLPALLQRWLAGEEPAGIDGVIWRDASGAIQREADRANIAMDDVAPYAWDLLPALTEYKAITGESEGLTPVDSGRGCAYDCSFCSIGRYWSRRSRPLPAAQLAAEILALEEHPGAKQAYLCHDLFGANRAEALELCERLKDAGAPVAWEARARLDHMDAELAGAMRAAGGYRVLLGVESADPAVRRRNQKGMRDGIDLLAGVDACVDAGITPILSLILGLPGEDEEGLARTLDFCADAVLRAGVNLSLHLANPQPGCELGDEYAQGSQRVDDIPPDMAFGAGNSAAERELIAAHPDLFSTWHLLPWGAPRLRDLATIARELPEVLMRFPRTFSMLRRRLGLGALALYRAWEADARSFEAFALQGADPLVLDVLEWERAAVRASARSAPAAPQAAALSPERGARRAAELVRARHDLSAVTAALRTGAELPEAGAEQHFAVQTVAGPLTGVRTLRLTGGAARLLETLDGEVPLAVLEQRHPGMTHALTRLAEAGLVTAS